MLYDLIIMTPGCLTVAVALAALIHREAVSE